jgi:hypothetical protein
VRISTDALGATEPSRSTLPRRFSPVRDVDAVVPVLYAGQDLTCALGETVFHDLDDDPRIAQEVLRADLLTLRASTLEVRRDLILGDLRDPALSTYGVTREQVVATSPAAYPTTAQWAQHAWAHDDVDGLVWHSRRCQERLAFVLFLPYDGERGVRRRRDLDAAAPPLPLWDGPGLGQVMTAASNRNVTLVIASPPSPASRRRVSG